MSFTRIGVVVLLSGLVTGRVHAGASEPLTAREALVTASAAAFAWAEDAELVYLENDEPIDAAGRAERWGFLYRGHGGRALRGYSIEGRVIRTAEEPPLKYDAPPVQDRWIDSTDALLRASERAAEEFDHAPATVKSLFLSRGIFDLAAPDRTTWTVVFVSADGPSLFVVLDATDGRVRKAWRG